MSERYCQCGRPTRAATQSLCRFHHSYDQWRRRYFAAKREKSLMNTGRDVVNSQHKSSGFGADNTASALTKTLKGTQSNG